MSETEDVPCQLMSREVNSKDEFDELLIEISQSSTELADFPAWYKKTAEPYYHDFPNVFYWGIEGGQYTCNWEL